MKPGLYAITVGKIAVHNNKAGYHLRKAGEFWKNAQTDLPGEDGWLCEMVNQLEKAKEEQKAIKDLIEELELHVKN
jgi:hypothetical protein